MKQFFILIFSVFFFTACSVHHQNVDINKRSKLNNKMQKLSLEIKSLSNTIDIDEAKDVAFEAVTYSKVLANEYEVVAPALFHNTLINMNIKSRGLCYHYANDLLKHLKDKDYKSFKFAKAISNRDEYFEHSSIIITTDNTPFEESIILDAWRDTGDLYFSKVKDDTSYKWEKK